jgi:hypothetical protein
MGVGGWGDCTYENQYIKEGGIWKIRKLHASFNMYTSYKEGWEFAATPNTRPDSFPPPPDLPPTTIYLNVSELLRRAVSLPEPGYRTADAPTQPRRRGPGAHEVTVCLTTNKCEGTNGRPGLQTAKQ